MKLNEETATLFVFKHNSTVANKIFYVQKARLIPKFEGDFGSLKVKCQDGKKFSFSDRKDAIETWIRRF